MTITTPTKEDRITALTKLGFALSVKGGPIGKVKDNWPHIVYEVQIAFGDRRVLVTDYSLGVGHVFPNKVFLGPLSVAFTSDEARLIETWASKPQAQFADKELWASAAAKLAAKQKVVPTLSDVLYSLMSDGEAYFNAQSFEQWAYELGYEPDSRKAEAIYKACDDIGRKLAAYVPAEVLKQVREILQDY